MDSVPICERNQVRGLHIDKTSKISTIMFPGARFKREAAAAKVIVDEMFEAFYLDAKGALVSLI